MTAWRPASTTRCSPIRSARSWTISARRCGRARMAGWNAPPSPTTTASCRRPQNLLGRHRVRTQSRLLRRPSADHAGASGVGGCLERGELGGLVERVGEANAASAPAAAKPGRRPAGSRPCRSTRRLCRGVTTGNRSPQRRVVRRRSFAAPPGTPYPPCEPSAARMTARCRLAWVNGLLSRWT